MKRTISIMLLCIIILISFIICIIGYLYELFPGIFPDRFFKVFGYLNIIVGVPAFVYLIYTAYKLDENRRR